MIPHLLSRILDDCLLSDSELEEFRQSALLQTDTERERESAAFRMCLMFCFPFLFVWLFCVAIVCVFFCCTGTMDTHPPDTYFGIEVEPSALDQ